MTRIVWIYGGSGAGKETFIRAAVAGKLPTHVLRMLPGELAACDASISRIGRFLYDPRILLRAALPRRIVAQAAAHPEAAILVKGQDVDFLSERQRATRRRLPHARHRIVYLDTSVEVQYARWKQKPWWKPSLTQEDARRWLDDQLERLHALRAEFPILALDASTPEYRLLPGHPLASESW